MTIEVNVTGEFARWYEGLTDPAKDSVGRVVDLLEELGTGLGFPRSSAISGSTLPLRELRIQHRGDPFRILYIFDPARNAVLLIGGSKAGQGNRWYAGAIRQAERLYTEYLQELQSN